MDIDYNKTGNLKELLMNRILPRVSKPTRYMGNEWNAVHKNPGSVDMKVALAFPDVYDVGMSHLGLKILYDILNRREDTLCERAFAPWIDMEREMRAEGIPLFSLESFTPLGRFDIIGFTLQYELSFTNLLNMLDLAGIPLLTKEREDTHPLVIAGSPGTYNPEPLWEFADLFVIGDGEEIINDIVDIVRQGKRAGMGRREILTDLCRLQGIYVPSFYNIEYLDNGEVSKVTSLEEAAPFPITRSIVKDLNSVPFPEDFIVPYMDIIHDRAVVELFRGCTRGCRFCQAGMIYRPVRERNEELLREQARKILKSTGYNELSLMSLSSADYSRIESLAGGLAEEMNDRNIGISLPSLRVDSFSIKLAEKLQSLRKTGLTFAPEAGTQRLRDVINKGVSEEDLLAAVRAAFEAGWSSIKLYFMIGLPTERDEDIAGIAELTRKVRDEGLKVQKEMRERGLQTGGRIEVTASASSFVPKAHTPFQWFGQDSIEELSRKQSLLKSLIKGRGLKFNWHDPETSFLEGVFSRGDRRLSAALWRAWELGCRFDGWSELFDYESWRRAFDDTGIDPRGYARRSLDFDSPLPWDHIDSGVSKKFLIREAKRALAAETTQDCRFERCGGCGICGSLGVKNITGVKDI